MNVLISDHVFDDLNLEQELLGAAGATLTVAPDPNQETLVDLVRHADGMVVCHARITGPSLAPASVAPISGRCGFQGVEDGAGELSGS
jgi:hypothetical protein